MHEHLKRRTFAIISHPDAGKTTLTEKLLLFGGAIQMRCREGRKATRQRDVESDASEQDAASLSRESVMQFPYAALVNLLDTPGHEDFSEDTYGTLTAVDIALMVIDAAKARSAHDQLHGGMPAASNTIISFINSWIATAGRRSTCSTI